jgi:hypothetical protein
MEENYDSPKIFYILRVIDEKSKEDDEDFEKLINLAMIKYPTAAKALKEVKECYGIVDKEEKKENEEEQKKEKEEGEI